MRLTTVYEIADQIAPFALSKEYCAKYGAYDNSGILLDCGEDIKKILFSLDLSSAAVARAKETGANLLVTHHPAVYSPLHALGENEGKNVLQCARAGISVISAHLNLDCAAGGIDECLMHALGGSKEEAVMELISAGGYGRVFSVPVCGIGQFAARAQANLSAKRVFVYGDAPVERVASFCGAGLNEGALAFASDHGADTVVSSDIKHHILAEAAERRLNVIVFTHYAAEDYGFHRFYQKIKEKSGVPCEHFRDERFL